MRQFEPVARSLNLEWCATQGTRKIRVAVADHSAMRSAILHPLVMGSRGRYCVMDGLQVPHAHQHVGIVSPPPSARAYALPRAPWDTAPRARSLTEPTTPRRGRHVRRAGWGGGGGVA